MGQIKYDLGFTIGLNEDYRVSIGNMATNTEVSTLDKAEDGKDLDTKDPRDGGGDQTGPAHV